MFRIKRNGVVVIIDALRENTAHAESRRIRNDNKKVRKVRQL